MKNRLFALLLALVLTLSLAPCALADFADGPDITNNAFRGSYSTWASPVGSYLFENPSGGLTRVEYVPAVTEYRDIDGKWTPVTVEDARLVVEDYTNSFELLSSRWPEVELPIWGGFFAGENFNFLFFGQDNVEENDAKEVIRVVKYSKNWKRLGSASVYGANTIHPFDAGSLRCAEYGDILYIRTCHEMYTSSDGLNHQANMTIVLDESAMEITDTAHLVEDTAAGYASHSFNQFIAVDSSNNIVAVDHGDAYPRAVEFYVFGISAGDKTLHVPRNYAREIDIQDLPGSTGANTTGASVGGLAETSTGYVTVFNYDGTGSTSSAGNRSVYLSYIDKSDYSVSTATISAAGARTPVLAPTGPEGGWVMWNTADSAGASDGGMSYARYASDGTVGDIRTVEAVLSDCQPIQHNGSTVWYATDGATLCFYVLDSAGELTRHELIAFSDVKASDYFYEPVKWALKNAITNGDGSPDTFNPNGECTRAHVLTFLYRAVGGNAMWTYTPQLFDDVNPSDYFFYSVNWAYNRGILTRSTRQLSPYTPCPRSEVVLYLWRAAGCPQPASAAPFADISPSDDFYTAALWAREAGISDGIGNNLFGPENTCTRAQVVTFLQRFVDWQSGK